jgi:four helix bundle protein
MNKIKDFKDLRIGQLGMEIVKSIYIVSGSFPQAEQFGLSIQMRRTSISVPSNIAEGFIKSSQRELNRFLDIALGSCAELETQVLIAKELNYLDDARFQEISAKITAEIKQILTLKNRIKVSNQITDH